MESTGIYHELLAELAHKRGLLVYVLNPKDARHYAKAWGFAARPIASMPNSSPA